MASTASLHASLRPSLDEVSQRAIEERNPTEVPIAPDAEADDTPRSPLDDEDEHSHAEDDPEAILWAALSLAPTTAPPCPNS